MSSAIVQCFFSALSALREELRERGSDLAVLYGDPVEALVRYARSVEARAVWYNEDYEPFARERDAKVAGALDREEISVTSCLDHVYFGAGEIVRTDGAPYKVFTPYRKQWLATFWERARPPIPSLQRLRGKLMRASAIGSTHDDPTPEQFGFASSSRYPACSERVAREILSGFVRRKLEAYGKCRDFPAVDATSHLSPQLRAGTIGIRTCIEAAKKGPAWLNELIWREFYQMILAKFPKVVDGSFLPSASDISWRDSDADFAAWCAGETGYPIVDAAMRGLNETGWMHNRLRMIVASFLVKDLLIDWRRGERYFEQRLADGDLAQNNGGWQWCASTGTDAVPYFRIFNPVTQAERFDPEGSYVKSALPELAAVPATYVHAPWKMERPPKNYPPPIVDHDVARRRALAAYGRAFGR
jgi:deoxyribodipyrimidine photo-lyase